MFRGRVRLAFQKILSYFANADYLKVAVPLYAKGKIENHQSAELTAFLAELIQAPEEHEHVFLDWLALLRSQLSLQEQRGTLASSHYVEYTVENFPVSTHKKKVQYLLVTFDWNSNPSRLRVASDILSQIKAQQPSSEKQSAYSAMIVERYFLNRNYENV